MTEAIPNVAKTEIIAPRDPESTKPTESINRLSESRHLSKRDISLLKNKITTGTKNRISIEAAKWLWLKNVPVIYHALRPSDMRGLYIPYKVRAVTKVSTAYITILACLFALIITSER